MGDHTRERKKTDFRPCRESNPWPQDFTRSSGYTTNEAGRLAQNRVCSVPSYRACRFVLMKTRDHSHSQLYRLSHEARREQVVGDNDSNCGNMNVKSTNECCAASTQIIDHVIQ